MVRRSSRLFLTLDISSMKTIRPHPRNRLRKKEDPPYDIPVNTGKWRLLMILSIWAVTFSLKADAMSRSFFQ